VTSLFVPLLLLTAIVELIAAEVNTDIIVIETATSIIINILGVLFIAKG
jgi:hypothetical protein